MSTKIKDERVDARILEATLTREDVATALYEFVCRRAKVDDYEVKTLDLAKSTFRVVVEKRESGSDGDVAHASVTVRLDTSRLPKCAPAAPVPRADDVAKLISDWNASSNTTPLSEVVEKIRDLCR